MLETLTVGELIAALQQYDPHRPVVAHGRAINNLKDDRVGVSYVLNLYTKVSDSASTDWAEWDAAMKKAAALASVESPP
jgi:hypothetical protein